MSRANTAVVALSLLLLVLLGVAASRCGRNSSPAPVVIETVSDTATVDSTATKTYKKPLRIKKVIKTEKPAKIKEKKHREPSRRNYLDERVD